MSEETTTTTYTIKNDGERHWRVTADYGLGSTHVSFSLTMPKQDDMTMGDIEREAVARVMHLLKQLPDPAGTPPDSGS